MSFFFRLFPNRIFKVYICLLDLEANSCSEMEDNYFTSYTNSMVQLRALERHTLWLRLLQKHPLLKDVLPQIDIKFNLKS